MDTINLRFKYTQSEYVKADRKYLLASKTISKANIIFVAAFFVFSVVYLLLSSFSGAGIFACTAAVIAGMIGCVLYFLTPAQKFKSYAKFQEEYSLAFSVDGISFKTSTVGSELKWDIYLEAWECHDFYFLIQASRTYTLIPKRAFASAAEMKDFEYLIASKMKLLQV